MVSILINRRFLIAVCFILFSIQVYADISLPNFFSDHMVLQQDQSILIFGKANPDEVIEGIFKNETIQTVAKSDGSWSITFKSAKAGGPYILMLNGENKITLKDVYLGEVWFCSGQSNMGWTIEKSENGQEALKNANFEQIKLLNVKRSMSGTPQNDIKEGNKWETCTTKNAKGFSAVAYFFGRELYKKYQVPIGLIHASWGGASIEAWMNAEAFKDDNTKQQLMKKIKSSDLNQMLKDFSTVEKNYGTHLDAVDLGSKNNWQSLATDYSEWKSLKLPEVWRRTELKQRFGIVWVTKTIVLSAKEVEDSLALNLGRIDNEDMTYFNGKLIGQSKKTDFNRNYTVTKELLRVGLNRITVRTKNPRDIGGFRSSPKDLYYQTYKGKESLVGQWNYKVGTPNIDTPPERVHPKYLPSSLYNAMLHPFFNYTVRGAIWYQGESNMNKADEYAKLFPMMINDWRVQWNKEISFLFVQLPNIANKKGKLPEFREAQESVLNLKGVGMATIIDIGEDYNIHPINKLDVGKRLAIIAEKQVYRDVAESYHPTIEKIVSKDNMLLISFKNPVTIKGNDNEIKGFELSGNGKIFTKVTGKRIDEKTIAISHLEIMQPIVIRYLWEDAPKKVMIFDKNDMPLPPFAKQVSE